MNLSLVESMKQFDTMLKSKLETLNSVKETVQSVVSQDPTLNLLKSAVLTLVAQVTEMKSDLVILQDASSRTRTTVLDLGVSTAKTEQYSRRNTIVIAGQTVDKSEADGKLGKLPENVCKLIKSVAGVDVKPEDFSAIHRNSYTAKNNQAKNNEKNNQSQSGDSFKPKVPSITVAFYNSNLKDDVLQNYRNYDTRVSRPRPVKVYQSLSKHYTTLKNRISDHCKEVLKAEVQWIHWRSQSAGLCIKFKSGTKCSKVFSFEDFLAAVKS